MRTTSVDFESTNIANTVLYVVYSRQIKLKKKKVKGAPEASWHNEEIAILEETKT